MNVAAEEKKETLRIEKKEYALHLRSLTHQRQLPHQIHYRNPEL